MTIKEFLDGMTPSTAREYRTSVKYFNDWKKRKRMFPLFSDFLLSIKMAQATRIKHLRQVQALCKKCNIRANFGSLSPPSKVPPLVFTDDDFQKLYGAFKDCDFPKIIPEGWQRQRFWQTLIHFAVVTATRRKAILGLTWDCINFDEMYVIMQAENDKKGETRYKPLTAELVRDLQELRRFYPSEETKVFPWIHGNKCWYRIWRKAEQAVGKRFHLHDLKRFSGELALRAGATPLELMQHMDHRNITTTMKHYVRPQTKELISRIKVPIQREDMAAAVPLFSERELESMLEEIVGRYYRKSVEWCIGKGTSEQRTRKKTKGSGPLLPGILEEGGGE